VGISATTGAATGVFRRVTKGSAHEATPACGPDGMLAFASVLLKRELWSLPLGAGDQRVNRKLRPLLAGANEESPSLSSDGRTIVFTSDRSGRHNIWLRNLETGAETHVERSMFVQNYPVVSSSGQKVAYSVYGPTGRAVFVVAPGCPVQKVCEGCTRATDWTRDETKLLTFAGAPYQIGLLDVKTHEQVCLLRHRVYSLLYAKFSPDQRWISFTIRENSRVGWIAIAPLHGDRPIAESEWRRLAQVEIDDYANWSSDGRTLLFTSSEDGYPCLWALPFDSQTGRPAGNRFVLQHLHGQPAFEHGGWTSGGKQVVLSMVERNSNVWTMSR
jgi:Tol biopolymer transport system component